MIMNNQKELSMEAMEQITGGLFHAINTGIKGMNAVIRAEA